MPIVHSTQSGAWGGLEGNALALYDLQAQLSEDWGTWGARAEWETYSLRYGNDSLRPTTYERRSTTQIRLLADFSGFLFGLGRKTSPVFESGGSTTLFWRDFHAYSVWGGWHFVDRRVFRWKPAFRFHIEILGGFTPFGGSPDSTAQISQVSGYEIIVKSGLRKALSWKEGKKFYLGGEVEYDSSTLRFQAKGNGMDGSVSRTVVEVKPRVFLEWAL